MALAPPDPFPCWDGPWARIDDAGEMWLFASLLRTVDALPRLHPWRLGDVKGSRRIVRWSAVRDGDHDARPAYAALTEQARDPQLRAGDAPSPDGLLASGAWRSADLALDLAADLLDAATEPLRRRAVRPATQWAGVVARLPGAWLPTLAVLPRAARDLDDPGTRWTTESDAFNSRHTVHCRDERFAADLLAPHVMALVLDQIPDSAAVTVSGDALHVWWEHTGGQRHRPGLLHRMVDTVRALADAIPSFLATDHPDRSGEVESDLADRAEARRRYQAQRTLGHHPDPVMQRIYDQARSAAMGPDVSSSG
ncbi:MAG: hypothetical protein OEV62_01415 [Actinomycetota bacterium]|nr:hypothetical protein [Actinomycetota bacterium]